MNIYTILLLTMMPIYCTNLWPMIGSRTLQKDNQTLILFDDSHSSDAELVKKQLDTLTNCFNALGEKSNKIAIITEYNGTEEYQKIAAITQQSLFLSMISQKAKEYFSSVYLAENRDLICSLFILCISAEGIALLPDLLNCNFNELSTKFHNNYEQVKSLLDTIPVPIKNDLAQILSDFDIDKTLTMLQALLFKNPQLLLNNALYPKLFELLSPADKGLFMKTYGEMYEKLAIFLDINIVSHIFNTCNTASTIILFAGKMHTDALTKYLLKMSYSLIKEIPAQDANKRTLAINEFALAKPLSEEQITDTFKGCA